MQHLRIKIFAETTRAFALGDAIPVFHRWIQKGALPEMLIDVADYRHVPAGPGVVLVGHDSHYSLDSGKNRFGLLYTRRTSQNGTVDDRLRDAWKAALTVCDLLEKEPEFAGKLRFRRGECEVSVNDRLLAPNDDSTWQAVEPSMRRLFDEVHGPGKYTLERRGEPRELFTVSVSSTS